MTSRPLTPPCVPFGNRAATANDIMTNGIYEETTRSDVVKYTLQDLYE